MTNVQSPGSNMFSVLARFYETAQVEADAIADEIDHSLNLREKIHDMEKLLRDGNVSDFLALLQDPANAEILQRFGEIPSPSEKVIDQPGFSTPEVSLFGQTIVESRVIVQERSHMEYSDEQLEGMKDTLKGVTDELSQLDNRRTVRFQMKNQGATAAFNLLSDALKSDHDRNMVAINNSKG